MLPEGLHYIAQIHNSIELCHSMMVTNEPGCYNGEHYGIRIENVLMVMDDYINGNDEKFLRFAPLTYCPIDLRAIDASLLTDAERDWLNDYHRRTYETLSPHLSVNERVWLKNITQPMR